MFQLCKIDVTDKQSANLTLSSIMNKADGSLKQKAVLIWCLVRHFILIFGDLFADDSLYLDIVLMLLQIILFFLTLYHKANLLSYEI